MKHLKRTLTLVLAAAIMLSMTLLTPLPHVQAAANDHIAASYASCITVETDVTVGLYSEPVSSSAVLYTVAAGTILNATALHKNTAAEYWYEVNYAGISLYVIASAVTYASHVTSDVTFSNPRSPACLGLGNAFSIGGTVSSSFNALGSITVAMYTNSSLTGTPVLSASAVAGTNSYTLAESTIAGQMTFELLPEDDYTYVVTAEAVSYYINSGVLTTVTNTVVLEKKACIINATVSADNAGAFGIDVGFPQGNIDWSAAAEEVDFAIIRIGQLDKPDAQFQNNVTGCETYGVPYGFYIYSRATTPAEAIVEAQWVLEMIEGTHPALPVYFNYEDYKSLNTLTAAEKTAACQAFCNEMIKAGYQTGVYSTADWFNTDLNDPYFDTLPKWISDIDVDSPAYSDGVRMWLYSWAGSVSGISGDVDLNYYYGELPAVCVHSYVGTVTPSTCLAQGYTTYTCSLCGDSYVADYTAIADHNYVDNACTVCGGVSPDPYVKIIGATLTLEAEVSCNIYFTTANINVPFSNYGLLVWHNAPADGSVDHPDYTLTDVYRDSIGTYIRSQGIAAKNMDDTLYFMIYVQLEDGSRVYSKLIDYSPTRYAYNILGKASSAAALKDLMIAMLNYGAEAQISFNHNPDQLMNAGLTEQQKAGQVAYNRNLIDAVVPADSTKTSNFVQADGAFLLKQAGITTTGALAINFFFYPGHSVDNGMTMYYWDSETYNSVDRLSTGNACGSVDMTLNNGYYEGVYSNIAAKDVEETVYVAAVYESGGTVYCSNVVSYSLAQYCFNASANTTGYKALGEAIVIYSYYAKIYFNKA